MFYSMQFIRNEWGNYSVRAVRREAFKSLQSAIKALSGKEGYVKQLGVAVPIWSNV